MHTYVRISMYINTYAYTMYSTATIESQHFLHFNPFLHIYICTCIYIYTYIYVYIYICIYTMYSNYGVLTYPSLEYNLAMRGGEGLERRTKDDGTIQVICCYLLQSVEVCCSLLICVLAYYSVLRTMEIMGSFVAICCRVLMCVAACCSVLQTMELMRRFVAICCSLLRMIDLLW